MRRAGFILIVLAVFGFSASGFSPAKFSMAMAEDKPGEIKFPEGYSANFTNYLSLDRTQNDDQIIRLFANDIAIKGLRETGAFPDGSVLVGEIYKARKNAAGEVIETDLGRRVRDKLAVIAVMEKRKGFGDRLAPEFKNGDWDFAAFKPDGSAAGKDLNQCRACHAPLAGQQHVFSIDHLK